jgi:hypothetical protein
VVRAVLGAVETTLSLDKLATKMLTALADELSETLLDHNVSGISFLDCAPGLRELLNISADFWEETSILPKRANRCSQLRQMAAVVESSLNETSDESSVDEGFETESEEMEATKCLDELQ